MQELYEQAKEQGRVNYHGAYCLYNHHRTVAYDGGGIRLIRFGDGDRDHQNMTVCFEDGTEARWTTDRIDFAFLSQFGMATAAGGKYVLSQTWERGLFCLDARTGEQIWRTKSKRGITSVFVNENTVLVHQRERALQLIDLHTGKVLQEKRPATSWSFKAIDHKHIVCCVTARRVEIIDTKTMETKQTFSAKEYTGGHEDYCVNKVWRIGQELYVRGFKNVWDDSVSPPKHLPNLEFEHRLPLTIE